MLAGKSAEDVLEGVALLLGTIGVVGGIGAVGILLLGCIGSRVLDLLVGLIDLVHLLGGGGIPRIEVGVISLGQATIGRLDLLLRGAVRHAEDFIGIFCHVSFHLQHF